jgi:hypothetical protein
VRVVKSLNVPGLAFDHEQLTGWWLEWFVLRSFNVRCDVARLVRLFSWIPVPAPMASDQPLDMPLSRVPVLLAGMLVALALPSP